MIKIILIILGVIVLLVLLDLVLPTFIILLTQVILAKDIINDSKNYYEKQKKLKMMKAARKCEHRILLMVIKEIQGR